MKTIIATLLIAVTIGEAYSQDRGRRNRGDRGNGRVERSRNVDRGNRNVRTERRPVTRDDIRRNRDRGVRPQRDVVGSRTHRETRRHVGNETRRHVNTPPPRRHVDRRPHRPNHRVRRYHARPSRNYYGSRRYHSPYGYRYLPYNTYRHTPYGRRYTSSRRYRTRFDYYNFLRRNYRSHIYLNWVLFPSSRVNGYYFVDNYPYYIHNGYRHRYSYEDTCNYQLVDKYTHQVVRSNYPRTCNRGYDSCAMDRDNYNSSVRENRYFCAETIHGDDYDYSRPTYDYDEWDDYNYNTNNNGRTTCYDYDAQTGICYDNY